MRKEVMIDRESDFLLEFSQDLGSGKYGFKFLAKEIADTNGFCEAKLLTLPFPPIQIHSPEYDPYMVNVPELILQNSSRKMPVIGMGTAVNPSVGKQAAASAILQSIKVGYRHFDTGAIYGTEQPLGEAIVEALRLGIITSRDELFITSKLWLCDAHPNLVLPAIQNTLRNLQLEYLDLYLIHWPISTTPGNWDIPIQKKDLRPLDYESVWADMEECQKLGLTKSIGVSNFSSKKIEHLLTTAKIHPAVNQVEMNPLWQQKKLREFCLEKGIVLTAYSPLGAKGAIWGRHGVLDCEVIHEIAKAKGKSHAQICLRWVYQQGVVLLVKSFNEERMKENLEIFDWELDAEELRRISEIPQSRSPCDVYVSPNGPFRTAEELWDE